jgi:hypothetical protein
MVDRKEISCKESFDWLTVTRLHRKKKVREFPVPSRDVTTKLSLGRGGNNDVITELFLPRGSLVSDIPAGDGKLVNLFLRCSCNECFYWLTRRRSSLKKALNGGPEGDEL